MEIMIKYVNFQQRYNPKVTAFMKFVRLPINKNHFNLISRALENPGGLFHKKNCETTN